jgi:hypothetical protein
MPTIDEELREAATTETVTKDKLDRLRAACATARDLELEIQDLDGQLRSKKRDLLNLRYKALPDLFMEARIMRLDLDASGNMPAYEAKMADHYHANISTAWAEERQQEAFDWLEDQGQGDLIKRTIEIDFGRDEYNWFGQVMKALNRLPNLTGRIKIRRYVPWNTLTAWLKEKYQSDEELGDNELRKLGAVVGKVVNIKPTKEK